MCTAGTLRAAESRVVSSSSSRLWLVDEALARLATFTTSQQPAVRWPPPPSFPCSPANFQQPCRSAHPAPRQLRHRVLFFKTTHRAPTTAMAYDQMINGNQRTLSRREGYKWKEKLRTIFFDSSHHEICCSCLVLAASGLRCSRARLR